MDDQTVICDPIMTNAVIDAVDAACQDPKRGGIRNRVKTHAIIYATDTQRQQFQHTWNLEDVQQKSNP